MKKRAISIAALVCFFISSLGLFPAGADELRLPLPGTMVHLSAPENPPMLKGIVVYPNNPFKFDFILDQGNRYHYPEQGEQEQLKTQASKLIKYFLASITTPEDDLWVNLSPYEKDRIIAPSFGQTDMGRDLLAEDYILKQITASLIYPEGKTGRRFWEKVYAQAQKKFGTTNIPVNTFNKVWIVPDHAKVYEHGPTAFVMNASLKVMLEEDYLSMSKHANKRVAVAFSQKSDCHSFASQIIREIVIPQLTTEINEGKNFAVLRQIYNSLILATWFKKRMKDSILGRKFMDKNKTADLLSPNAFMGDPETIYQRYLKAFKKGVYNYIKEEYDSIAQEMVPRKYFSGGWVGRFDTGHILYTQTMSLNQADLPNAVQVTVHLGDTAMASRQSSRRVIKRIFRMTTAITALAATILLLKSGYSYLQASQNPPTVAMNLLDAESGKPIKAFEIYENKALINASGGEFWTNAVKAGQCIVVVLKNRMNEKISVIHIANKEVSDNGRFNETNLPPEVVADVNRQVKTFLESVSTNPGNLDAYFFHTKSPMIKALSQALSARGIKIEKDNIFNTYLEGGQDFFFGFKRQAQHGNWMLTVAGKQRFDDPFLPHIDFYQKGRSKFQSDEDQSSDEDQAMRSSPDRVEEMKQIFDRSYLPQQALQITEGISQYDPFNSPVSKAIVSNEGLISSGSRRLLMNKYGMVMLHSHEHPQSILVNRGYLFCCGVAIRAIKEGRIDVGLAHIYSQQDDVDDVLLKITHSLEEDDYKILEYVVSYARDEIEQHLKGRTYSQYEEDIQYHFPGIKIAFVSRNSENEKDDLAVDQQGVAIKRFSVNPSGAFSRDIHLVDWHRSTQTSATSNPAMRLNNAPGGIDLTPKRMGLDIASDKAMKAEPLNLKALEDMTINGLYIKDIAIKPLDNLPQLLEMTSH